VATTLTAMGGPTEQDDSTSAASKMRDPAFQEAVLDLLGALAYGELSAFLRVAADAELAPRLSAKAAHAALAATEFGHHLALCDRIRQLGGDPEAVMRPFVPALDAFHERTAPATWLEGLVKYYVGDGIAGDFFREMSEIVDSRTRAVMLGALSGEERAQFVVSEVRRATEADPRQAGRLALWGRRLVGEALSQAQQVAAERDSLTTLVVGSAAFAEGGLAAVGRMFERMTAEHTRRMERLGLNA
jgi:hypothetical protein